MPGLARSRAGFRGRLKAWAPAARHCASFAELCRAPQPELATREFSVADAFLLVVLYWTGRNDLTLDQWPNLQAYEERLNRGDAVAQVRRINLDERERILAAGGLA